jgi:hypothetical protein
MRFGRYWEDLTVGWNSVTPPNRWLFPRPPLAQWRGKFFRIRPRRENPLSILTRRERLGGLEEVQCHSPWVKPTGTVYPTYY